MKLIQLRNNERRELDDDWFSEFMSVNNKFLETEKLIAGR